MYHNMNNKFWNVQSVDNPLWNDYQLANTDVKKQNVLIRLMEIHPDIIKYLWNKADSCFGEHIVYLIKIEYKGESYLKIGYTKNSIKDRFAEKRYVDRNEFKLVETLRESKLQALGALQFESDIHKGIEGIRTEMKMPGKGELYSMDMLDTINEMWDSKIDSYKSIIGLKAPN
jgi:hypothetical protein